MNTSDPLFYITIASIVIAVCFIIMAVALIAVALIVRKLVTTVNHLEERVVPLLGKVTEISEQGRQIAVQFTEVSNHVSDATKYLADSVGIVKDEVAEIRGLVSSTALVAKNKVELVSDTIDRTQNQVVNTTDFIHEKIVEPAREIAAVMAGVRKGLEVLFAPPPKRIDRAYHDDEMFIG